MATIDRIVVPLDGSDIAENALRPAGQLAKALGVEVELVHVHGVTYGGDEDSVEGEVIDAARGYLQDQEKQLQSESGVSTRITLLEGVIATEIANHLRASGSGLVVMTTHGRSGFSRLWLGSTTETLVRTSPWPVLLIRQPEESAATSLERILVTLDGSERAEMSLPWARAIAGAVGGNITLFRAVSDDDAKAEAESYLGGLVGEGEEIATVVNTSEGRAIIEKVGQGGVDLVALTTSGRGAVARTIFGSVADKVLRSAETPVLVLSDDDDA